MTGIDANDPTASALPRQFADLEPLLKEWDLPDRNARYLKRRATSFEELKAFYKAVAPRMEDILRYLDNFPLGKLPPEVRGLQQLVLALADMKMAVECLGAPEHEDAFDVLRLHVTEFSGDPGGARSGTACG